MAIKERKRIENVTIKSFDLSSEATKKGNITIIGDHTFGTGSRLSSKKFIAEIDKDGQLKFDGPDDVETLIKDELIVKFDDPDAIFCNLDKKNLDLVKVTIKQFKKNNTATLPEKNKSSNPKPRFDGPDDP